MIDGFGAIKAGHTGWLQADTAAQNIVKLIHQREHPEDEPEALKEYIPGKPQIKVTLGLVRPRRFLRVERNELIRVTSFDRNAAQGRDSKRQT